jgi:hypothetical protein
MSTSAPTGGLVEMVGMAPAHGACEWQVSRYRYSFRSMSKYARLQDSVDRHRRLFVLTGADAPVGESGRSRLRRPMERAQPVREKLVGAIGRAASSAGGAFVGSGQTTRIALCRGSRRSCSVQHAGRSHQVSKVRGLLQERGPLFGSGMTHCVMAEIPASLVLSGRYAPHRSTYETARPVPFHATRNTNSPHTFAFQRASRASWRGSHCCGRAHLDTPVRGSPCSLKRDSI